MSWQGYENREKSGKIGDFPGSGPNPGKRHFVRSLPKTLHFFATFPIRSNCNSLEPPFFPVFPVLPVLAGQTETCKIRGKMPILPYFRKVETKVKTAVFSLFWTSKFDGFSRNPNAQTNSTFHDFAQNRAKLEFSQFSRFSLEIAFSCNFAFLD